MKKFLKKILSIVSTVIGFLIPIGSFFFIGRVSPWNEWHKN